MRRFLSRLQHRLRRHGPRLKVRPSVPSLHELAKDAAALLVSNVGRATAFNVVVSIRVRSSAFQFDEIASIEPHAEAPLLHQSNAGFTFAAATPSTNWFRIVLRTVVRDAGTDLRIPLAVSYKDGAGRENVRKQTLHCDEDLRLRVTDG